MKEPTQVEPQGEKAKVWTAEEFAKAYGELCEKMGWRIVVNPAWIARDDGSWSLVLQTSIGKLPRRNP